MNTTRMKFTTWAGGIVSIICLLGLIPCASAADLIRSKVNPEKCLAKSNDNWQNGNPIRLWDCSAEGDIAQAWVYNNYNGYIYAETNRDKCFHKAQRGWANGNRIHLWDCSAGRDEMKTWRYDSSTGYIRSAVNPNKCLHKQRRGWGNGNRIHLWDCDAGTEEMKTWNLTHQDPFRVGTQHPSRFQNRSTGRCLRIADADNRDGGSVTVSRCRDTRSARPNDQLWNLYVVPDNSGYMWLRHHSTGKCLNINKGQHDFDGGPITAYPCANNPDQHWRVPPVEYEFGGRPVYLEHRSTERCLNVHRGRHNFDGAPATAYTCNRDTRDQKWDYASTYRAPVDPPIDPPIDPPVDPPRPPNPDVGNDWYVHCECRSNTSITSEYNYIRLRHCASGLSTPIALSVCSSYGRNSNPQATCRVAGTQRPENLSVECSPIGRSISR